MGVCIILLSYLQDFMFQLGIWCVNLEMRMSSIMDADFMKGEIEDIFDKMAQEGVCMIGVFREKIV